MSVPDCCAVGHIFGMAEPPTEQTVGMSYKKICVEVLARFLAEGGVRPIQIVWSDGRRYPVVRICSVQRAPARVSAVLPLRYTCMISGREKELYYEPDRMRWFVEIKE